jgi:hypothetical protein
MGLSVMESDNEKTQKAETLYRMLCMNKEASIKYLNGAGKICKIENSDERKEAYSALFADLVQGISQTKKR